MEGRLLCVEYIRRGEGCGNMELECGLDTTPVGVYLVLAFSLWLVLLKHV